MQRIMLAGLIVGMLTPAALARDELRLSAGTMRLGGAAALSFDMAIPERGDNTIGLALNIIPSAGYFIIDNLELVAEFGFWMGLADLYQNSDRLIGFGFGAKYHAPVGNLVPYAGLAVSLAFSLPVESGNQTALSLNVPLGLLVPLNTRIALDLGLRIVYTNTLRGPGVSTMQIPVGYLGVQGFF